MIYCDTSALMKLARPEAETDRLVEWLNDSPTTPLVTSELGRIELLRAARRAGDSALAEAHAVLGDVDLMPLDRAVQDLACDIGAPALRTLDALHLASALVLGSSLTAFVSYDHRLADAAEAAGLELHVP